MSYLNDDGNTAVAEMEPSPNSAAARRATAPPIVIGADERSVKRLLTVAGIGLFCFWLAVRFVTIVIGLRQQIWPEYTPTVPRHSKTVAIASATPAPAPVREVAPSVPSEQSPAPVAAAEPQTTITLSDPAAVSSDSGMPLFRFAPAPIAPIPIEAGSPTAAVEPPAPRTSEPPTLETVTSDEVEDEPAADKHGKKTTRHKAASSVKSQPKKPKFFGTVKPIGRVTLGYPHEAKQRGIEGSGIGLLTVDPTGHVTGAVMQQGTGSSILDEAALRSFRSWRFAPGTPGAVRAPITFKDPAPDAHVVQSPPPPPKPAASATPKPAVTASAKPSAEAASKTAAKAKNGKAAPAPSAKPSWLDAILGPKITPTPVPTPSSTH